MASFFSAIIALFAGLTIHEFSHAFVANLLGDPTAKLKGRVSLNPLKHLDPLGGFMLIFSSLSGFGFGWGKPVPVNPYNLKKPHRDEFFIAFAGPFSNFLLALLCVGIYKFFAFDYSSFLGQMLFYIILINISLMMFNLIPIPPLDGSKVLGILFPRAWQQNRTFLEKNGMFILLAIIFFGGNFLGRVFIYPVISIFGAMLGIDII